MDSSPNEQMQMLPAWARERISMLQHDIEILEIRLDASRASATEWRKLYRDLFQDVFDKVKEARRIDT